MAEIPKHKQHRVFCMSPTDDATTLATMCYQYNEGRQFNSSGRDMYVQFHSDGSNEDTGFSLTYQAVLPVTQSQYLLKSVTGHMCVLSVVLSFIQIRHIQT